MARSRPNVDHRNGAQSTRTDPVVAITTIETESASSLALPPRPMPAETVQNIGRSVGGGILQLERHSSVLFSRSEDFVNHARTDGSLLE
jgi:hypothetical protein